jgi:hypothetical protein
VCLTAEMKPVRFKDKGDVGTSKFSSKASALLFF